MAYVSIPNDLSKIKTKLAFNLTSRQLVCFGCGAAVGIPAFLLTRSAIGNSGAMFLMLAVMLPAFFMAMYEKDGQPHCPGQAPAPRREALPDGKPVRALCRTGGKGGTDCRKISDTNQAPQGVRAGRPSPPSRPSPTWKC